MSSAHIGRRSEFPKFFVLGTYWLRTVAPDSKRSIGESISRSRRHETRDPMERRRRLPREGPRVVLGLKT